MTQVRFSHFELNRNTIKAIAVGPGCTTLVTRHAELAKAHAVTLATARVGRSNEWRRDGGVRGKKERAGRKHYVDAFEVDISIVHGITPEWPLTRVAGRVANTARHAIITEFGHTVKKRLGGEREIPGHYVLTDTIKWLWSFDTSAYLDEPGGDTGYEPPEDADFDAGIELDFGDS
ncbi:hypothetical protein [Micromonospora maritima]|uniref:hypothetical protein n=1 Tax=Micromonospora maritima TaxID=986711 RepID=UPI00157BB94F|nr:hypothetical protein [Micromonospora maritima]